MASRFLPDFLFNRLSFLSVIAIFFFSSTQLGLHFWPSSAFLYGLRLDYLSPTLYFLDILILVYLALTLPRRLLPPKLFFLFPLLLTNLLFSHNPLSTLSWSLHLLLYLSFLSSLQLRSHTSAKIGSLRFILPLTLLFQLLLGVLQVIRGSSLQGIFYFLGERAFSLASPNVAKGEFIGEVILRAYGTFSHPNVLAGWSVVTLLILTYLVRSRKKSSPHTTHYLLLTSIIVSTIIFLTQSRSAALALFGLVIPFYLLKSLRSRIIYFCLSLTTCYLLLTTGYSGLRLEPSFGERLSLQATSFQVIRTFPIFGTGAQASISTYPSLSPSFRFFQPDHNSFTLFLSWFGFFGTLAMIYCFRTRLLDYLVLILPLFPILFLDHHLLTSPQGLFVFLLYLKLANFAKLSTHEN